MGEPGPAEVQAESQTEQRSRLAVECELEALRQLKAALLSRDIEHINVMRRTYMALVWGIG